MTANEDAQAPLTAGAVPTGSLGVAVRLAQNRIQSAEKQRQAAQVGDTAGEAAAAAKARVVVLCGPSGVGKSTLIARLLEDSPQALGFSVSCTTRRARAGEVDGVDYNFVVDKDFDDMIANGEFVEWASVGNNR